MTPQKGQSFLPKLLYAFFLCAIFIKLCVKVVKTIAAQCI